MCVARSNAEQKVGKVHTRLQAVEGEAAVEDYIGVGIDLVRVDLATCLEAVLADNAGEGVADFVDVLGLHQGGCVHAQGEVVEGDVFNPHGRGLERKDAGEALVGERGSNAALGLADGVCVAHIAQVELVQRRCAEGNRVAHTG